jgi:fibronectin-binding autotransporter adhesin
MRGQTRPGVWTQLAREMVREKKALAQYRPQQADGLRAHVLASAVLVALTASASASASVSCTAAACTFTAGGDVNTGAISTQGTFTLNYTGSYAGTVTQAGAISGSGSVSLASGYYGGGRFIFTGNNTYGGNTVLTETAGSLQLGTTSTVATLAGNITVEDAMSGSSYYAGSVDLTNLQGANGASYAGTISHAQQVELAGTTTLGAATLDMSSTVAGQAGGTVEVDGSASTGASIIENFSTLTYATQATAGTSTITAPSNPVGGSSLIEFLDHSNAQNATIYNDAISGDSAGIYFNGSATAGNATINNGSAKDAVAANTIASPSGNTVQFWSDASAGNATINNYNGYVLFDYTSTVGQATVNNHNGGIVDFNTNASAGTATINNDTGSSITFEGDSTAGQAVINNLATADVDISQNGASTFVIGTLNGGGDVYLGSNTLSLGGNNANDSVGALHDGFGPAFAGDGLTAETGGALLKEGAGVLVMSGNSDYTGGTTIAAGTLQLGNGGGSGSVLGNIVDNGILSFDRSDNYTFTGVISGSGSVYQTGSGRTVLAANQTYSGGTFINAGTLAVGADSALGNAQGGVTFNGGTLQLTQSVDLAGTRVITLDAAGGTFDTQAYASTISQGIDGTGGFTKAGSGTLVLAGNNTYTGGTAIDAGALQIGSGGTAGNITGNVADNGSLLFDRSDDYVFAGALGGGGNVHQIGSGTLVFTGNGTYTGGTFIDAGTLQVGNGGTSGSIAGNVTDNGSLRFDRSDDYVFAGALGGGGNVHQIGSGTLVLTGNGTYTGGTFIDAGALQLGSGGTSGGLVGNVTDNGTLSFDRSDRYAFGGVISGSGSVYQVGSGQTQLGANQTYAGGTFINAGTLAVGADTALGNAQGGVTFNGGTLQLTQSFELAGTRAITLDVAGGAIDTQAYASTVSQGIAGIGCFTKVGSGTLVLTGNNTYTGGTAIDAGTLQIGSGGASGDLAGNVTDSGVLSFDRSDNYTFAGNIAGTGSVTQAGSGTLVLAGSNSYLGGTTIASGTVEVTRSNALSGTVQNNGTLSFVSNGTISFSGSVSGTGPVVQQGGGTLTWNASSRDTGATSILGGGLVLGDASHASANVGGDLLQARGTTLSGFGQIQGNANLDGVVAPGNSSTIGTLSIGGNLVLGPDAQLQSKILPVGGNDLLQVAGSASLNGSVVALVQNQPYAANVSYVLLHAQQGVSGQFGAVSANFAFVDPQLIYSSDAVALTLVRNAVAFQDAALTRNQIDTAASIGSLPNNRSLYGAVEVMAAAQARATYDELSGEIHASVLSSLVQDSLALQDAISDELFNPAATCMGNDGSSGCLWARALGGGTAFAGNPEVGSAVTRGTGSGLIAGAQSMLGDSATGGVMLGTRVSSLNDTARSSTASTHDHFIGAYASGYVGSLVATGGVIYSGDDIQTSRQIQEPTVAQSLSANYHAPLLQAFAQAGWSVPVKYGSVMPYFNATAAQVQAGHFSEVGGDGGLSAAAQTQTTRLSTLGIQTHWTAADANGNTSVDLSANVGWQHAYGQVTPRRTLNFIAGGDAFDIYGNAIARNAAVANVGAGIRLDRRTSLDLRIATRAGDGVRDNTASATLTIAI